MPRSDLVACGSCYLPLQYSEEWHAFVHAVVTASECLTALKCPAFGKGIPQPYRIADVGPTFDQPRWNDWMTRERR